MALQPLDRIVSLGNDGVYTSTVDAATARDHLRDIVGSSIAVEVSNPFPNWPRLDNFLTDNNPNPSFSGAPQPQFIWSQTEAQPDDQIFFAVGSKLFTIEAGTTAEFTIHLISFSDNAHQVEEIRLFEVNGVNPPFAYVPVSDVVNASPPAFSTAPLEDAPLTQPIPETGPPYGWHTVRFYSNTFFYSNPNQSPKTYQIVVVFRTKNYPIPVEANANPGGLAFAIDIYANDATLATTP